VLQGNHEEMSEMTTTTTTTTQTGNRVGKPYASKRSAQAYADRNWTGPDVPDRDNWHIDVRHDEDGWWCYITEVPQPEPTTCSHCERELVGGECTKCEPEYSALCGVCHTVQAITAEGTFAGYAGPGWYLSLACGHTNTGEPGVEATR
jgi:hypothetical protein